MKSSWIITGVIVGVVLLGIVISFPIISENEKIQNQIEKKNKLQELSKKGVITYDFTEAGKNIVDYRLSPNDVSFPIDPMLEKSLREKQRLFTDSMVTPLYSDNQLNIPANYVSISREWKAVEIGIDPDLLTEQNIPDYFEEIRNIIGNQTNIVLTPSYPVLETE